MPTRTTRRGQEWRYRLLRDAALDDRAVKAMTRAYEDALQDRGLADRNDPITEIVANKIIELARAGSVLGASYAGLARRDVLATHPADAGLLSLIDPGSEWRLHRLWFKQSARADLLGADYALVEKNALYRCLDKPLVHKTALFSHLRQRWQDLFGAKFEVLLYDLTSTCSDSPPPDDEEDKRRHGYSRDKRSDCVQVVIALIVTLEGFSLAYEVLPGNTADSTTLPACKEKNRTIHHLNQACQPCATPFLELTATSLLLDRI